MPLQKQIVQLPFQGLNTIVDPKIATPGTYSIIDNLLLNTAFQLEKRDGLQQLAVNTTPSNIIANYSYLTEVGLFTNNSVYSYSPSLDQFQNKGQTSSPIVSAVPVIANTYTQTVCDGQVTVNSVLGTAWEDTRGGVRCSIQDTNSETFIVSDFQLSVTGTKPKVIACGNILVFLWIETATTTLKVQQFNTITTTFNTSSNISTNLRNIWTYDAINSLSNVLIVTAENTAVPGTLKGWYWNVVTQALGSGTDGLVVPISLGLANTGTDPKTLSLTTDSGNTYIGVTYSNNSNQVYTSTFYTYLAPIVSEIQVTSATTDNHWSLATCIDDLNNTYIFYSTFNTVNTSFRAQVSANITSPSVALNANFIYFMGVTSRAFFYSGNAYVVLNYPSSLQNTYFGMRFDGACWARLFTTLAGGMPTKTNSVSSFTLLPGIEDTYVIPLLKTTKITSSGASYFTTTSVFYEEVYFTPKNIDNRTLGTSLNIAGGYVKQYDGSPTVFEQGFHLYPEQPTLVQSAGSGSIANGSYSYVAVWEWQDNHGQLLRSQPSVPQTITTTGSNNTVTVTVRPLPLTNKETRFSDTRTPVVLAIYRTQSLGTTYNRVNQLVTQYVYNTTASASNLTFVDTFADATIASNSLLYTTGGVYGNIALPATNLLTTGKNRVFVGGTDTEPNRIYFSKEIENGIGLEFSNELTQIVDGLGGKITALATMDDKIVIFKKSLMYYISGQGPDKVGNGSFTIPILVSADCGCNHPQSIVLTGKGLMFQSQKGIYLLDRQLNVSYVGSPVNSVVTASTSFEITSASNLPDRNLVTFTTTQDGVIIYNTYFDKWFTGTYDFSPTASAVFDNNWYVSGTDAMYLSVQGKATDGIDTSIQSKITTAWISLNSLEGYGRLYDILIAGDNAQLDYQLCVNLYYDFETFPRQSLSITPNSLNGSLYGADSPYGEGSPYGGFFDGTFQFQIKPQMQKCTAIRIEIFDQFPTGNKSKSFKFSGMTLVIGSKNMQNKNLSPRRRLT